MADIDIRVEDHAGRMTLNRPGALNALTADMAIAAEAALDAWSVDDRVQIIVIDAVGEKAFCAGGDIAELYEKGCAGAFDYGQAFWRQEYRLNLKLATYPKPVVSFMQGFTMGGGVGVGCHAAHRIVGESSKIAMPECGIGLVPDVGGSYLLGRAPGASGVYLGLTGTRMSAADAIYAGFADHFVPQDGWDVLKEELITTAELTAIDRASGAAGQSALRDQQAQIDAVFGAQTVPDMAQALTGQSGDWAERASKSLSKGAPLALACALRMIRAGADSTLADALALEYRFTSRAQQQGDFLEGIRAQIIDRDFAPKWAHNSFNVPAEEVDAMLAPLGAEEWTQETAS